MNGLTFSKGLTVGASSRDEDTLTGDWLLFPARSASTTAAARRAAADDGVGRREASPKVNDHADFCILRKKIHTKVLKSRR
jgi:hypothetical protein